MLSILIPAYNYNIFPLVKTLYKQCLESNIIFEIICLDDASHDFLIQNYKINRFKNTSYIVLEQNIGRSAIRNLLAQKANFENLLFLDADTIPVHSNFISNYLAQITDEEKIVYGGILYSKNKPPREQVLRWTYGNKREALPCEKRNKNPYLSFLTLNFLIRKSVFEKVRFNETIPNLRHEDTLFSYNLMQENIKTEHIDNPVYHYGMDDFEVAIRKEKESLSALKYLIDNQLLSPDYVRISKLFTKIKKLNLVPVLVFFHKVTRFVFLKNLKSKNPSLHIFDFYRLGYLAKLEEKKNISKTQSVF